MTVSACTSPNPATPLLGVHPRELTRVYERANMRTLTTELPVRLERQGQPGAHPYMHGSLLKTIQQAVNKPGLHIGTWLDSKTIVLSRKIFRKQDKI